ncbi:MAG: AAA domain-containing protein [Phycisphaera sp.]|nr:AAA domain-containing protein [Phycisphaera sp.]
MTAPLPQKARRRDDRDLELERAYAQLVRYAADVRTLTKQLKQLTAELPPNPGETPSSPEIEHPELPPATVTIVGQSPSMKRVVEMCRKVARAPTTVLVCGETGTGKELTARLIHDWSDRRDGPYHALNCAALTETLLESELFGHEKGAFTGATHRKAGMFELASGGTLFLDEVGEMSLTLQAKLLRVLEDRTYRRVGGEETLKTNVRIVTATNRDLEKEVDAGNFRQDLYYRLNIFVIRMPSLSSRVDDIPALVQHFLRQHAKAIGVGTPPTMSQAALGRLATHGWPGNIRELRNVIERSMLMAEGGVIEVAHLPDDIRGAAGEHDEGDGEDRESKLEQTERGMILKALEDSAWNKAAAARELGISWDNLRYRIKKYGLTRPKT